MEVVKKTYYNENDFYLLKENSWSGALQTLDDIERNELEQEFMFLLENIFPDEVDETELNDFIWFDRDYMFEQLGLDENGEKIEE